MSNIDVRKCFEAGRPPQPPMIKDRAWSADLAYERLKAVRKVEVILSEGINTNSIEIPPAVAEKYEGIWRELKAVEQMEITTVKYGR